MNQPFVPNVYLNPGANIAEGMSAVELNNRAHALSNQGDYAGAEALYKEALVIKENSFGPDSIQAALTRNSLGEQQLRLGKLDDAEENLRKAVEIRNAQKAGFDAAVSRENLAQVLEAKGDLVGAKAMRASGAPNEISCGNYNVSWVPDLRRVITDDAAQCPGQMFKLKDLMQCAKCMASSFSSLSRSRISLTRSLSLSFTALGHARYRTFERLLPPNLIPSPSSSLKIGSRGINTIANQRPRPLHEPVR
jgi:tetratricopeptide (TPR) repeat protein